MLVSVALVAAILHTRLYKGTTASRHAWANTTGRLPVPGEDPPWLPVDAVVALIFVFALFHVTMKSKNVSNGRDLTGLRPWFWLVGYELRRRPVRSLIGTLA